MVFLTFPDLFIQFRQPSLTLSWRDVAKIMSDKLPRKATETYRHINTNAALVENEPLNYMYEGDKKPWVQ